VDGRRIPALVQLTKQAWAYVFDRRNGQPVWPLVEKPVPQNAAPGEWLSPTQPFPARPGPFDRQGVSIDDLIDFTPELRAEAVEAIQGFRIGPLFTPPDVHDGKENKGLISVPGFSGGANWYAGAADPETGFLYVPSVTSPTVIGLSKNDPAKTKVDADYVNAGTVPTVQNLPLLRPPYGRITAYDMNRGEIAWQVPNGDTPQWVKEHQALQGIAIPKTGNASHAGLMATKTLLIAGEGPGGNAVLHAYDKATGADLAQLPLPGPQTAPPMTYMHQGRQFIVIAVRGNAAAGFGAQLVAFALPRNSEAAGRGGRTGRASTPGRE
jgi:quinoprotein glucose dehydrogenase